MAPPSIPSSSQTPSLCDRLHIEDPKGRAFAIAGLAFLALLGVATIATATLSHYGISLKVWDFNLIPLMNFTSQVVLWTSGGLATAAGIGLIIAIAKARSQAVAQSAPQIPAPQAAAQPSPQPAKPHPPIRRAEQPETIAEEPRLSPANLGVLVRHLTSVDSVLNVDNISYLARYSDPKRKLLIYDRAGHAALSIKFNEDFELLSIRVTESDGRRNPAHILPENWQPVIDELLRKARAPQDSHVSIVPDAPIISRESSLQLLSFLQNHDASQPLNITVFGDFAGDDLYKVWRADASGHKIVSIEDERNCSQLKFRVLDNGSLGNIEIHQAGSVSLVSEIPEEWLDVIEQLMFNVAQQIPRTHSSERPISPETALKLKELLNRQHGSYIFQSSSQPFSIQKQPHGLIKIENTRTEHYFQFKISEWGTLEQMGYSRTSYEAIHEVDDWGVEQISQGQEYLSLVPTTSIPSEYRRCIDALEPQLRDISVVVPPAPPAPSPAPVTSPAASLSAIFEGTQIISGPQAPPASIGPRQPLQVPPASIVPRRQLQSIMTNRVLESSFLSRAELGRLRSFVTSNSAGVDHPYNFKADHDDYSAYSTDGTIVIKKGRDECQIKLTSSGGIISLTLNGSAITERPEGWGGCFNKLTQEVNFSKEDLVTFREALKQIRFAPEFIQEREIQLGHEAGGKIRLFRSNAHGYRIALFKHGNYDKLALVKKIDGKDYLIWFSDRVITGGLVIESLDSFQKTGTQKDAKLGIFIKNDGKIGSVKIKDPGVEEREVREVPERFVKLVQACFAEALIVSSSYAKDERYNIVRIEVVQRGLIEVARFHWEALASLLTPGSKTHVKFLKDDLSRNEAIDAGGPSRSLFNAVPAGLIKDKGLSFAKKEGLWIPEMVKADPQQSKVYENWGKNVAYCFKTPNGAGMRATGTWLHMDFIRTPFSLTAAEIDAPTNATRFKIYRAFQTPEQSPLINLLEKPHWDENDTQQAKTLNLTIFGDDLEEGSTDSMKAEIAANLTALTSKVEPVLAFARGMKAFLGNDQWDSFRRSVTPEEFSKKAQGNLDRTAVASAFVLGEENPVIEDKTSWLQAWILDPATSEEDLRKVIYYLTGMQGVVGDINVFPIRLNPSPIPEVHTCSFRIHFAHVFYTTNVQLAAREPTKYQLVAQGGLTDDTPERFIAILKDVSTNPDQYNVG